MRRTLWILCLAVAASAAVRAAPTASRAPARPPADAPVPAALRPAAIAPGDRELYERLSGIVAAAFDSARGGFVERSGEPNEAAIELMLARGRDGDRLALARGLRTLAWTRALLDTVGGGYVNGTRDQDVRKAFLDKGTIPNARRFELLTEAWQQTHDESWKHDARFVVDYFERVLLDPRGGFYTGQVGSVDLEPESNGIALQAWWRWAAATDGAKGREFAWNSQRRLWSDCRMEDLGFVRRTTFGAIREPSLLGDQAEMGRAHLYAWSATGRDSELALARQVGDFVVLRFRDPAKGAFRLEYANERFGHAIRVRRPFDDNARAARFLAELGRATGDTAYVAAARAAWTAFERDYARSRMNAADWALAVRALWSNDLPARSHWGEEVKPKAAPVLKPAPRKKRK